MEKLSEVNGIMESSKIQLQVNYETLADLFFYPQNEEYKNNIKNIHSYLSKDIPEAANAMQPFIDFIEVATIQEMQELFLRSFDLQAITTLDIGFVLFGEDYKRGKLLVHLNKEHSEAGNICHTELSDHLPNVLNLIAKMKDIEIRDEIASRLVMPAVDKMISEFSFETTLSESASKWRIVYNKTLFSSCTLYSSFISATNFSKLSYLSSKHKDNEIAEFCIKFTFI